MLKSILVMVVLVLTVGFQGIAQEVEVPEEIIGTEVEKMSTLDAEIERAGSGHEKAELLHKKCQEIMKNPEDSPATIMEATKTVLSAIEIDPYDEEYKKTLFIIYDKYWKGKAGGLEGRNNEGTSQTYSELRSILQEYNTNKNFNYLIGPFTARKFIRELNRLGIILSPGEGREFDKIKTYSTENGWFEIEGSDKYYELYAADINNDKETEVILAAASDKNDSIMIEAVFSKVGVKQYDIFDQVKGTMWAFMQDRIKKHYGLAEYPPMQGVEIIIEKIGEGIYFTQVMKPFWEDRAELGEEVFYCRFKWEEKGITLKEVYTKDQE